MTIEITTRLNAQEIRNLCKGQTVDFIRQLLSENAYSVEEEVGEDSAVTMFFASVEPTPEKRAKVEKVKRGVHSYPLDSIILTALK